MPRKEALIYQELKKLGTMKLLDKIDKFYIEAQEAEENYKAMGANREEHQEKMLAFIRKKMDEAKKRK